MKSTKRLIFYLCLLIALAACGGDSGGSSGIPSGPSTPTPTSTAVTGVSVSKSSLTLIEGGSETVSATVTPSTALNKNVSWKSSDESIASIDSNGMITARKPGTATITATTLDGNKTATLTLTVTIDYIARQKKVLIDFYNAMKGDSWMHKDGWKSDEVELKDWYGITMEGNYITSINLAGNNLKGKIPASLGETIAVTRALSEADTRSEETEEATTRAEESQSILGNLKSLDLSSNEISGSIPPEIGNLNGLSNLNLSGNDISGAIPPEVGKLSGLSNLDLSGNKISGPIPPEMGNLKELQNLDLGSNNISGSIPPEIGNLTNLTNLDLGGNDLSGDIPTELGNLSNLESLNISDNKLSGDIPPELLESDMWKNLKEEPDLTQQGDTELPEPNPTIVMVTSVSINKTTLELTVGDSETLIATIYPSDATIKKVSWSSSNNSVAVVYDSGIVFAIAAGNATLTVTAEGGKTATCNLIVKAAPPATVDVTSVEFPKPATDIVLGSTLYAGSLMVVKPDNATDKSLTWSSSDNTIATVNKDGDVKGIALGKVTITATSNSNPTIKGSFELTVKPARVDVTGVSLNKSSLTLNVGDTETLTATVSPADATDKSVTWSSNNIGVATVDANGKVRAIAAGTATITVKTNDGGKVATCNLTVKAVMPANVAVTGVSLNKASLELSAGDTETLVATVNPSDATNKNVSWNSNNTGVATVDANGKVTAIAAGNATITVTTADGGKTATCTVTVKGDESINPEASGVNPGKINE